LLAPGTFVSAWLLSFCEDASKDVRKNLHHFDNMPILGCQSLPGFASSMVAEPRADISAPLCHRATGLKIEL
jgi:hypothetical protein